MPSGSDKQGSSTPSQKAKEPATAPTPPEQEPLTGAGQPPADADAKDAEGAKEGTPDEAKDDGAKEGAETDADTGAKEGGSDETEADADATPEITGDRSAAMQAESVKAQKASGGRPRPTTGQTREQVVLRAGDTEVPFSATGETDALVTLNADVWQEVWPENAQRPSHILLFHAGQVVPKSKLDAALAANAG